MSKNITVLFAILIIGLWYNVYHLKKELKARTTSLWNEQQKVNKYFQYHITKFDLPAQDIFDINVVIKRNDGKEYRFLVYQKRGYNPKAYKHIIKITTLKDFNGEYFYAVDRKISSKQYTTKGFSATLHPLFKKEKAKVSAKLFNLAIETLRIPGTIKKYGYSQLFTYEPTSKISYTTGIEVKKMGIKTN